MRKTLTTMLMKCPDVQVVGTARDGREAIAQVQQSKPDIMTLDVDMPGMDGLAVLDYVMGHHPLPVIMISALTNEGARVTFQALEHGAVDFIPKDFGGTHFDLASIEKLLHGKIREAYHAKLGTKTFIASQGKRRSPARRFQDGKRTDTMVAQNSRVSANEAPCFPKYGQAIFPIVVVGSSTGGPIILKKLVQELPEDFQALLIMIQHMPRFFTTVFSENLNSMAPFPIREARDDDELQPALGLVAPGDRHLSIARQPDGRTVVQISSEPSHFPYRPSIDYAMSTIAQQFGPAVIGIVLSGMGDDGVIGCHKIKENGGIVLVQNEGTALMYGMPRAVMNAGAADLVVTDNQLAECLIHAIETYWKQQTPSTLLSKPFFNSRNGAVERL